MKFEGELVTQKPAPAKINVSDSVPVDESLILHAPGAGVRVQRGGQSIADDLSPDGTVRFSITGKSPQKREGERETCQILIELFNRGRAEAEKWGDLTEQPEASPVDYEASMPRPPGKRRKPLRLKIQVALVGDQDFWQQLNTAGRFENESGVSDLTEALHAAVMGKSERSGRDIVLAVNARDTPRHSFKPVVDSFREKYGAWAAGVGFQEVWVVGPIPDMTERLDLL